MPSDMMNMSSFGEYGYMVNYVNFSDAAIADMGYGPGVVIEIMKVVGKALNLTYEVVQQKEQHSWGELINGTWTGAFGHLYRKEVDILAGGAIMEYERGLISDLTYPFQFEPTGMIIKSPEKYEDDTLLIVTKPFSWQVWFIAIVSVLISAAIFFGMVNLLKQVYSEVESNPIQSSWVFFSIFVQQGLPQQPKSWSCRILVAVWWLASITLSATFTGSLVALFAVDKTYIPFTNIDQLVKVVKQGKYIIVMDGNSFSRTEMIAKSQLPVYKDLWHEISVNHRVKYVSGVQNGIKFVQDNPGYVLLGPIGTLSYYAYANCDVLLISEGVLPVYLSIPLVKNSPYTAIKELLERGFTLKWINDYRAYEATLKSRSKYSGYLDLKRAQGAFWLFLIGIVLGAITFVIEIGYRYAQKKVHIPVSLNLSENIRLRKNKTYGAHDHAHTESTTHCERF